MWGTDRLVWKSWRGFLSSSQSLKKEQTTESHSQFLLSCMYTVRCVFKFYLHFWSKLFFPKKKLVFRPLYYMCQGSEWHMIQFGRPGFRKKENVSVMYLGLNKAYLLAFSTYVSYILLGAQGNIKSRNVHEGSYIVRTSCRTNSV